MSRGELCTCYVRLAARHDRGGLRAAPDRDLCGEPFVPSAERASLPQTQMVRGSNYVMIGVVADRIPGRAIVISTLDNLVKGSAGQAIQNFNVAYGIEETTGIEQLPLFP